MVKIEKDDAVWCIVMFDLPVKSRQQRAAATGFRNLLVDSGMSMVQYSVYCQYLPQYRMSTQKMNWVKNNLPPEGQVRILLVTDTQWSSALRFWNSTEFEDSETPLQLTIF